MNAQQENVACVLLQGMLELLDVSVKDGIMWTKNFILLNYFVV